MLGENRVLVARQSCEDKDTPSMEQIFLSFSAPGGVLMDLSGTDFPEEL